MQQWEAWRRRAGAEVASAGSGPTKPRGAAPVAPQPKRGLTYKEKQELAGIEAAIEAAETERDACRTAAEDPVVATQHVELQKRYDALAAAQARVDALYARWQELDEKRAAAE
jgi:ATP-binding cassette subfamily F protein uup